MVRGAVVAHSRATARMPRAMIQSMRGRSSAPRIFPTASVTPGVASSRRICGSSALEFKSPSRMAGSLKER